MAANKVVFGNKVLIDLTGDTVTEEALLKGYTAHKADGTIITGTAFAGYPNEFVFLDNIQDSSGNPIKDSSGKTIQGQTIYRKARNSVLLDSTGDVIEDGFEQQIEVVKFVWVSFISRLFLHLNPLGTVNAGQFVSSYTFPSKLTRGLTGIVYGDGFSYSDKRGNVIARYSDSGEKWGTFQQTLMINYDRLMSGLTEAELMPVWLFRLYREPSPKARERFENLMHSSDKSFMVWQEGNQFRFKELLPLEPERND